ncbi:hypothetical protein JX266_012029 [Neoarthrinium moseri]|nr:hypothetical protein JX266_012029 [Neoarthrinium moseri]
MSGLQTPASIGQDKDGFCIEKDGWFSEWCAKITFPALKNSAERCLICSALLRRAKQYAVAESGPEETINLKFHFVPLGSGIDDAGLTIQGKAESTRHFRVEFRVENVTRQRRIIAPVSGDSTGSIEALRFVEGLLQTCHAAHMKCGRLAMKKAWYPTRLIEIARTGPRLIVTRDVEPAGPYATLSHRWGSSRMFRCLQGNFNELRNNLPLEALPTTFKQAFDVIKALGITYIWIDSVCIIQDSMEDWAHEAHTMTSVYQQAQINIAATWSLDDEPALFNKRSSKHLISDLFHVSNGHLSGMFQAAESILDTAAWDAELEEAPLNRRGWVLQERILSPRSIHFLSNQIIWDCAEASAAETLPSGEMIRRRLLTVNIGPKRSMASLNSTNTRDEAIYQWVAIVVTYTCCQLTYGSDKFIALNGVKDWIAPYIESEYHYGLWRLHMEVQLCWRSRTLQNFEANRNSIAPSWSWASVDGPIEIHSPPTHHYTYTLLAGVVTVYSQDRSDTGQLHVGVLHLGASCVRSWSKVD